MIRSKMTIKGKTVAVCHVESKEETIAARLRETQVGKKRKSKTYHAYQPRQKENKREEKLKLLLISMVVSKQRFEAELLKAKIKLKELRKALGKEE